MQTWEEIIFKIISKKKNQNQSYVKYLDGFILNIGWIMQPVFLFC